MANKPKEAVKNTGTVEIPNGGSMLSGAVRGTVSLISRSVMYGLGGWAALKTGAISINGSDSLTRIGNRMVEGGIIQPILDAKTKVLDIISSRDISKLFNINLLEIATNLGKLGVNFASNPLETLTAAGLVGFGYAWAIPMLLRLLIQQDRPTLEHRARISIMQGLRKIIGAKKS